MRYLKSDIILGPAFMILAAAAAMPLLSGICLYAGERYEARYRWETADVYFEKALMLDPLDAGHQSAVGMAYQERSALARDRMPFLLKAEGHYDKAHRLNPSNTQYLIESAMVRTDIFLADKAGYSKRLEDSLRDAKEALALDPNNNLINFDIGRNLMRVWDDLTETDKSFALESLKRCLRVTSWFHWRVYPVIWKHTKDFEAVLRATPEGVEYCEGLYRFIEDKGLWEHRRKVTNLLKAYRGDIPETDLPEIADRDAGPAYTPDWQGVSKYGGNEYRDGKMYWSGQAHTKIHVPEEEAMVTITAKGTPAYEIWPYMIVELDGKEIGETFVSGAEWRDYTFYVKTEAGTKDLKVVFPNDGGDWEKGIDRNLFLGHVSVTGVD